MTYSTRPWAPANGYTGNGASVHRTTAAGAQARVNFTGTGISFQGSAQLGSYMYTIDKEAPVNGTGSFVDGVLAASAVAYGDHSAVITTVGGSLVNITGAMLQAGVVGKPGSVVCSELPGTMQGSDDARTACSLSFMSSRFSPITLISSGTVQSGESTIRTMQNQLVRSEPHALLQPTSPLIFDRTQH